MCCQAVISGVQSLPSGMYGCMSRGHEKKRGRLRGTLLNVYDILVEFTRERGSSDEAGDVTPPGYDVGESCTGGVTYFF